MEYKPGEIIYGDGPIVINESKPVKELPVRNTGDRAIQVGSHYHFFEVNTALEFEREEAFGLHLDIPSGTAVRFEPGEDKNISLVPYSGSRKAVGFMGLTMGDTTDPGVRAEAVKRMKVKTGEAKSHE